MKKLLPFLLSLLLTGLPACALPGPAGPPAEAPAAAATPEAIAGDIGSDAALEIALGDAGFSETQIELHKNMLGFHEDGAAFFIVFYQGGQTYDYIIDAGSGAILQTGISGG